MSVLAAWGEMGSAIPSDSTVIETTTSGKFNSSFARCAIISPTVASPFESVTFTETDDVWCHFDVAQDGAAASDSTLQFIASFYDAGGTARVALMASTPLVSGTGSASVQMKYWNGSAWTAAGSSFTTNVLALQTMDIHIVSNTASGSIQCYIAGTKRSDSGTIDLSSFTGIAKVEGIGKPSVPTCPSWFSQGIVADEPTIGWRLTTVPATGAGATTDFTGGYTEIDETVYSDADFINSGTANQVELFSHSTVIPTGYSVRAVAVTARAKKGASGPQNLQLALRSSGTTYFSGSKALDAGYGAFENIWETDPATSAAFTTGAIAALQFGVKSIT